MDKFLKYLKIVVFLIAMWGFFDLLINPKGIQYADSNLNIIPNYFRIITASLILISLGLLILYDLLKNRINNNHYPIVLALRFLFLLLMYFDINYFLKIFSFHETTEYIIIILYTLPVVFVVKDLIQSLNFKTKHLALLGFILTIPTLIYFQAIYEPYEDYWNGIPIMFVHFRIRNWVCFIGFTLILVSILRLLDHKQAKHYI